MSSNSLQEDANLYLPTDLNHPLENAVAAAVHKVTRSNKSLTEVDKRFTGFWLRNVLRCQAGQNQCLARLHHAGDTLMRWTALSK